MKECPHCKDNTLEIALTTNPANKPISYICVPCNKEFYVCPEGRLLTYKEYLQMKQDWQ